MGEVVGLGLRNLANCPVELNLMPESTLRWQSFNQKKPYLFGAVVSLVLVVFAAGWLFTKLAEYKQFENDDLKTKVDPLLAREQQFKRAYGQLNNATNDLGQMTQWIQDRYYWADTFAELRKALARVEAGTRQRLGADTGVWIEKFVSMESLGTSMDSMAMGAMQPGAFPNYGGPGYGGPGYGGPGYGGPGYGGPGMPGPRLAEEDIMGVPPPQPPVGPDGMPLPADGAAGGASTNRITLVCRGVDMSRVDSSANATIAYALEAELRQIPLFTTNTALSSPITDDPATSTFSFTIALEMNRLLK
jgi:hypothetical protein